MEMFTRDVLLSGPPADVRAWAIGIAESFGEATGRTPEVWTCIAGGTIGHHTWSMPCDGSAELIELSMQALADEAYLAKIEEGRPFFVGQPRDTIHRAFNDVGPADSEPGHVCNVTTAVASAGSLGQAVGWGLETAEYVTRLTGVDAAFLGTAAGNFSRLTWMSVVDSARKADEATRTINADDGYLKLIGRGGQYFVDGSARTMLFLRVG